MKLPFKAETVKCAILGDEESLKKISNYLQNIVIDNEKISTRLEAEKVALREASKITAFALSILSEEQILKVRGLDLVMNEMIKKAPASSDIHKKETKAYFFTCLIFGAISGLLGSMARGFHLGEWIGGTIICTCIWLVVFYNIYE